MKIHLVTVLSMGMMIQIIGFGGVATATNTTKVDNLNMTTADKLNTADKLYKSCKEIKETNIFAASGNYKIDPDGNGANKPFEVYCDMSGDVGLTFFLVKNGMTTSKMTDDDSCKKLGLKIFAPRNKTDYDKAKKYLLSIKEPTSFGPLGVYNPKSGPATAAVHIPMNSSSYYYNNGTLFHNNAAQLGWKSTAGDNWWISNKNNITEPNGDYVKNCWLGIQYDNFGEIKHYRDSYCDFSYQNYLCMSEDNYTLSSRCKVSVTAKTNEKQLEPDDVAAYHVIVKQESSCCVMQNVKTTVTLVDQHSGLFFSKAKFSLPNIGPSGTAETDIHLNTQKADVKKNKFKIGLDYDCVIVTREGHNETFDLEVVQD